MKNNHNRSVYVFFYKKQPSTSMDASTTSEACKDSEINKFASDANKIESIADDQASNESGTDSDSEGSFRANLDSDQNLSITEPESFVHL